MDLMKASIAHGVRPTALVLGKDSRKPWGRWDLTLAKAYQRFLNELCQQCGLPRHLCHGDDNRVQFRWVEDQCEAAKVTEREQAKRAESKDYKGYGVRLYAEPFLTEDAIAEGLEFSDFRKPYMIERAKKMGLIPEDEVSETTP